MRQPKLESTLLLFSALIFSCSIQTAHHGELQILQKQHKREYTRWSPGLLRLDPIAKYASYEAYSLTFRSFRETGTYKNDYIRGELFVQKASIGKLAVLLSGMGESESTVRTAETLAQKGYDVVRFFSKIEVFNVKQLGEELHATQEFTGFARKGAIVINTRLDDYEYIIRTLKRTHGYKSIGISGVSLGGIFSFTLAGRHPELFQSAVGMITGGDLAEILLRSTESRIKKIRDKIFQQFNIGEKEALKVLRREIGHIDPLTYVKNLDPTTTLLVSNYFDTVIPHKNSKKLWEAAGRPQWQLIFVPPGHYGSALALLVPVPLFEVRGPLLLPVMPRTADSIILNHFQGTLK